MRAALLVFTLAGMCSIAGCGSTPQPVPPAVPVSTIQFEDVAESGGIRFALGAGDRSPLNVLETAPGGAAFLDYDGDGRLDALLVGPRKVGLFRNEGSGKFADVTQRSGLHDRFEWMGCAVADYDGDGRVDVLLTGYGGVALFRNLGRAFRDTTQESGLIVPGWSLSATFADYDHDGLVDVYVPRFLRFDQSAPQFCQLGRIKTTCGPEVYEPQRGLLFRNVGGGRFQDVTREAGLSGVAGKGWTALFSDFTADGYPDLYIANDMAPCDFYVNQRGRFVASGAAGSVAYDANGHLLGAMGADSADFDRDGDFDLLVTTFFAQSTCLYRNEGDALFTEVGNKLGVGGPTTPYVGFGTGLVDFDNDGWLDAFIANGHVRDNIRLHDSGQDYAQPLQVFRGGEGRFQDVSSAAGTPFTRTVVGRGAAFGDYDDDGRLDVLVCNLKGNALLLKNTAPRSNHWLRVVLKGADGNTQALGARIEIEHGSVRQVSEVRTTGSVLSANAPASHFGLGPDNAVRRLTVTWPRGSKTVLEDVAVDRTVTLQEGSGPNQVQPQ